MNSIKENYDEAVVYTDDIEEYAKPQRQLICDNEISKNTNIRVMLDVHPGKVGSIGLTMKLGERVIPNLLGVDIGCEMLMAKVKTSKGRNREVVLMATYVISDIHGQYDMFMELIDKIDLKETDTLYVLGDILDRGPHPIKVLRKLMEMPNAICMAGNHELMALECLKFLMKEITDMSIEELDEEMLDNLVTWQYNGSKSTIDEFRELSSEEKQEVIDFIEGFLIYEEVTVSDRDYLLVHAGLGNYTPEKDIEDYTLHELIWVRADYDEQYFEDTFVITGHTPTQSIENNPRRGFIYKKNNHIAIDCGAHYSGGRLAAICLETGEEFYSSPNEMRVSII